MPDPTSIASPAVRVRASRCPLRVLAERARAGRCPLRGVAEFAGFTLVELLVVLAILAVILALLLPTISRMRAAADRAREIAAARTLAGAWQMYAEDAGGTLLPGYRSGLPAYDAQREPIAAQTIGVTANRWVWRLAPYLGNNLGSIYLGEHERTLRELEQGDYASYLYATSVFPSFGLNSVYVGGDESYGGFSNTFLGVFGKFYATRLSDIARPASLVVFASARGQDGAPGSGSSEITEGYFRVLPPFFNERKWAAAYDPADPASCGNLSARHGGEAVVSFADGHAEARTPESLDDMRNWANDADRKDWTITPQGG